MVGLVHEQFLALHRQFDAYHAYEGVANVYTINEQAGGEPVAVSDELFALLAGAKQMYGQMGGKVNIAMGAVLRVWNTYRELATKDPDAASVPKAKELGMAAQHVDINCLILDEQNKTVALADRYMSLDVGAVAKGYACDLVRERLVAAGYDNFVISAGGNVVTCGRDVGKDEDWAIGIQNPDLQATNEVVDTVLVCGQAVVTAGSYQRYFTVDGRRYHHIIDPATARPAAYYDSVTVICDNSLLADYLSTTLFILPPSQAMALAQEVDGVEAMWIDLEGQITHTDGYADYSKTY